MQIICLGDSITDCNHLFEDFPLGNGYVQMLSEMFKKETSFNNVQIKNYGFDGFTVARVLDNIRQHRISLHRSPVVTLLIGINDIGLMMNTDRTPAQQEEMMGSFQEHYLELLTILTKSSCSVILMEPFVFSCPAFYENWKPLLQKMSQIIRTLSIQFRLPFLSLQKELDEEVRRYGYSAITTDGVHLTRQGQQFLADRLYSCIAEHNYV